MTGEWPQLPQSEFSLSSEMKVAGNTYLTPMLARLEMSLGEMQALRVLVMLQCLAEVGPRKPTPGYLCQSVESIMCPLSAMGIAFLAHAMLATAMSF